ncbi:MAG: hypothetical protein L6V95_08030 [Candidatus Melainabacteria bacterium]|nr:MAG: hypothetical protein L6V95_08030 [Candidatus Melainabacteria bacterium]
MPPDEIILLSPLIFMPSCPFEVVISLFVPVQEILLLPSLVFMTLFCPTIVILLSPLPTSTFAFVELIMLIVLLPLLRFKLLSEPCKFILFELSPFVSLIILLLP